MLISSFLLLLLSGTQCVVGGPLSERSAQVANCTEYIIQDGDTCLKVGKKNKATYAQIVSWNRDVPSLCSKMKSLKGTTICVSNPSGDFAIPTNTKADPSIATTAAPVPTKVPDATNKNCGEYAVVKEGEDCSNLLTGAGITLDDFLVLNPQVWKNCTNLWLDYSYCVKPVGTITTYPGYGGSAVPSATIRPFKKTESEDRSNGSKPIDPFDRFHPAISPIPLAKGTRLDCIYYFWVENITDNLAADCWALARLSDITAEELILWNPSLAESNATLESLDDTPVIPRTGVMSYTNAFAYPCTISASSSYCIQLSDATTSADAGKEIKTPTPRAAGEISDCTMWFSVQQPRDCQDLMIKYSLEFGEFYKMNPSVREDCSGLVIGTYYCRSTYPDGQEFGIPGWSSSSELEFPPATSIQLVSSTSTNTGTKADSDKAATGTMPSPVQTGIVASCTRFHKVEKGDTCYDIAKDSGITLSTFYKWNPAVKSDCSALELGTYVCINSS